MHSEDKMRGLYRFRGQEKYLTTHEIIAQKYGGKREYSNNVIPDICSECHNQLENSMNKARASAGNNVSQFQSFTIGSVNVQLQTRSVYIDNIGIGYICPDSPIYGLSCHNKITGGQYIESAIRVLGYYILWLRRIQSAH